MHRHAHTVSIANVGYLGLAASPSPRGQLGLVVNFRCSLRPQIKRTHEYKRQLLNLVEIVGLYDAMHADPAGDWVSRVKAFSGKGTASFAAAKLIVKLANQRRDAFRFLTRGSSRRSFWAAPPSSDLPSKIF
jgi:hypothetical protein